MIKRIVYAALITGFSGLGFVAGVNLVDSGLVAFLTNLPQQFRFGLIGLTTLIGLVIGIPLSPLIMRGSVRLTVFIEQYLQRTPVQDLVMGSVGLIIGLIIANLMGSILSYMGWLGKVIWMLVTLLLAYLGLSMGIKKREDLVSFFANLPRFGKERNAKSETRSSNSKILDTSVIIDGRIADLCESGFIEGTLIIPSFVIEELRHIADSSDLLKRNRGRR
ncbi:MAG: PIN domain nuclease, partial [Desulfotomaculaceae bacterium]|nr:PIN domain nuclease [Desulfotomaculaceae bacterium]